MGEPHLNINNHPFTSHDRTLGLVHNGKVENPELQALRQKYETQSDCDSEIILRIVEAGDNYADGDLNASVPDLDYPNRLIGIRDVFSLINEGHMAVAIGERGRNKEELLWLFRNRFRPLWAVDMRSSLGQIFFVSEPTIWDDAVAECSGVKNIVKTQKLVELPTEEIWFFRLEDGEIHFQRYEVCKEVMDAQPWSFDGRQVKINKRCNKDVGVVTKLNEKDELVDSNQPRVVEYKDYEQYPITALTHECKRSVEIINDIEAVALRLGQEQSITHPEFSELVDKMQSQREDLEQILRLLGS